MIARKLLEGLQERRQAETDALAEVLHELDELKATLAAVNNLLSIVVPNHGGDPGTCTVEHLQRVSRAATLETKARLTGTAIWYLAEVAIHVITGKQSLGDKEAKERRIREIMLSEGRDEDDISSSIAALKRIGVLK